MIRDTRSNALINNDVIALNKYKMERNQLRRIENMAKELEEVKTAVAHICEILNRIDIEKWQNQA